MADYPAQVRLRRRPSWWLTEGAPIPLKNAR